MPGSELYPRIYDAVCRIPRGRVATYGQIALLAGNPRAARAVGWALHRNPMPGVIPCHRVVNREGRCAPAFAFGGEAVQRQMLEREGVAFNGDGHVDLEKYLWDPETEEGT
jgi:methylated-DNA-protein-cysteine methyltransferase related protein